MERAESGRPGADAREHAIAVATAVFVGAMIASLAVLLAWPAMPPAAVALVAGLGAAAGALLALVRLARAHRRRDEEAAALRAAVDAVPALIGAKDRDSRYIFMNAYQARLYGTTPEAAGGRTAEELLGLEYGVATRANDRRVIESGESIAAYEERYASADGLTRDWVTTKVPLRDRAGRVVGVGTVGIDVSDRKRAELALIDAKEAAEQASRAKSQFLANVSHELRTPLNAVIGFAEMIERAVLGPVGDSRYAAYAADIRLSGEHLLSIINEILDLSKIEAGKHVLREVVCDVARLIDEAVRVTAAEGGAGGATVTIAIPPALPPVRADERGLLQILINLLSNARKFTPPAGRITVGAAVGPAGELAIEVTDTGIGIAPRDLDLALSPFGQVEGAFQRRHGGTGLGLPLVRSLAELHGGSLELESRPGEGTCARVRLPAGRVVTAASVDEARRPSAA